MDQTKRLAIAELAKGAGKNPGQKSEFAEMIIESIEPNRLSLDFFNMFMPTRSLNIGDSLHKRVKNRGFPVYTFVPGTTHLAAVPVPPKEIMTYMLESIITKVRMNSIELNRGEIATVESLRKDMADSLVDNMVARIFALISSVWTGSTSRTNYHDASSGGIDATILTNMMETVLYYSGGVKAIVGTRRALLPVYAMAGFTERTGTGATAATVVPVDSIVEEWRRTGRVASFRGAPLIELPQVWKKEADSFETRLVPEDRILVIGDNAGEIILYGGTEFQDHTDFSTEPADYVMALWRSFGMIIDAPENIGYIKVADPTNYYHV